MQLWPIEYFGVTPTFVRVIFTFWPGFASKAVTSNFILSSAWILTSFGGADGAWEQAASAPQIRAMKQSEYWITVFFIVFGLVRALDAPRRCFASPILRRAARFLLTSSWLFMARA